MTEPLKLTITRAGLSAAVSAKDKGFKVELKWVSAGDIAYQPNPNQTSLSHEIARVEFGEYRDLGAGEIEAVAKFSGPEEFAIRELGFHLADGTLFGVISAPDTVLNYKPANGHCLQPMTLDLSALPTESVTVVVGIENLNIFITTEMIIDADVFLCSQIVQIKLAHMQMQLSEKLRKIEIKNV